jgi:hypothetical protein
MAVKLHRPAYEKARDLIGDGKAVIDERDDWSEHQASSDDENRFLKEHGWGEYGKWFLGIDEQADPETKAHYKFPYGDFDAVHRCGVLAAESRAGQYKHTEIKDAAAHLHGMLDAVGVAGAPPRPS